MIAIIKAGILPVPTRKGLAFYKWIDGKRYGKGISWGVFLKRRKDGLDRVLRGFRMAERMVASSHGI